jgi:hypothetical protein
MGCTTETEISEKLDGVVWVACIFKVVGSGVNE